MSGPSAPGTAFRVVRSRRLGIGNVSRARVWQRDPARRYVYSSTTSRAYSEYLAGKGYS